MILGKTLITLGSIGAFLFLAGATVQTIYERKVRRKLIADREKRSNNRAAFVLQGFAEDLKDEAVWMNQQSSADAFKEISMRLQRKADELKE